MLKTSLSTQKARSATRSLSRQSPTAPARLVCTATTWDTTVITVNQHTLLVLILNSIAICEMKYLLLDSLTASLALSQTGKINSNIEHPCTRPGTLALLGYLKLIEMTFLGISWTSFIKIVS